MNIADTLAQVAADVAVLKNAPAPMATVDLSPVTTAVAGVQTTVNDIDAKLTPTLPAA